MNTTSKLTEIALEYNQPLNEVVEYYCLLYKENKNKDIDSPMEDEYFDNGIYLMTKKYYHKKKQEQK